MPLATLDRVSIAYGHLPLLADASLQVEPRERVCVIGRNGTGKSTLLRIVSGELAPEAGTVWHQPGLRIGSLAQDVPLNDPRPVSVVVSEGIMPRPDVEEWQKDQLVALTLTRLGLPAQASVQTLSGGWKRRVLLARALVGQPDLLLLDEPTNHLDIETMTWLESLLADYRGAVVFVTHDRVFLQHVATRIVELDRGRLTSWPGDYDSFLAKKEEWLANEAVRHEKFDKRLAEEEAWLRQGIKARRTRNEGRVKALTEMRKERAARRARTGNVRLQAALAERSGQTVFETEGVTKSFGGQAIVRDLSIRVTRGDRIGLIGPNGSGKTTLLRLLIGELAPDEGEVRRGAGVQIVHYDQQREQLDPDRSVFDTIADGSDTVLVNGQPQHVHGYLKQFLFPPERALSPVRALSGGERNRLLLARLFTRPSNVLVLDEPTNDLDIETLELLEEMLLDWPGTLLLVSHDRAFIDNVVTSTLVFQEAGGSGQVAGEVKEYVGGYEDWLRQRPQSSIASPEPASPRTPEPANSRTSEPPNRGSLGPTAKKLTYREREELDALPGRIEALEAEQRALEAAVASPDFYKEGADAITRTLARQEAVHEELLQALARWDELESRPR
ncbi:MAG: ABC transporter ATP-binding protein [Acidobacteria bacterium]|nr:MAG: ABC transporter ATP-binding protein [Acidobacteriota bacterium]